MHNAVGRPCASCVTLKQQVCDLASFSVRGTATFPPYRPNLSSLLSTWLSYTYSATWHSVLNISRCSGSIFTVHSVTGLYINKNGISEAPWIGHYSSISFCRICFWCFDYQTAVKVGIAKIKGLLIYFLIISQGMLLKGRTLRATD